MRVNACERDLLGVLIWTVLLINQMVIGRSLVTGLGEQREENRERVEEVKKSRKKEMWT